MSEARQYSRDERRSTVLEVLAFYQKAETDVWIGGGADLAAADAILASTDHIYAAPAGTYTKDEQRQVIRDHLRTFQIPDPWLGTSADLGACDAILNSTQYMHEAEVAYREQQEQPEAPTP